MTLPLLTILIPGVPTRFEVGERLIIELERQAKYSGYADNIEILWLVDNFKRTVGAKRQALLDLAQGEYVTFCDDDDLVASNYIIKIMEACREKPDVITFDQSVNWNGDEGTISFGLQHIYGPFFANQITYRPPWHMCVWKSEIAKQCKFPDLNWSEDVPWMEQAKPLAKTEIHIPEILHIYVHYDETSESLKARIANDEA